MQVCLAKTQLLIGLKEEGVCCEIYRMMAEVGYVWLLLVRILVYRKTGDLQNYGGAGHSSHHGSCPFKEVHFHFLLAFGRLLG